VSEAIGLPAHGGLELLIGRRGERPRCLRLYDAIARCDGVVDKAQITAVNEAMKANAPLEPELSPVASFGWRRCDGDPARWTKRT
jgi:hypothetical protein